MTAERTVGEHAAWCKVRIAEHRVEWERRANPFYVWEAMKHCPRDEPLPDWICDYLAQCSVKLGDLAFPGRRDPKLSPGAAAERIPEAMGFRRHPNWNAIRERRHDNEISGVLLEVVTGRNSGTPPRFVIKGVAKRLEKSARQIRNLRDEAIGRVIQGWRDRSR